MLLTSCASIQSKFRESQTPDQLWDELSKDLVELQVMVNSLNQEFELEDVKLNEKDHVLGQRSGVIENVSRGRLENQKARLDPPGLSGSASLEG